MLKPRKSNDHNHNTTIDDMKVLGNHPENPNSAKATANNCRSERDLRVPCYCEENVWRLAYRRIFGRNSHDSKAEDVDKENEQYYVVFVSNDDRCCPMLNQRASKNAKEPCFWDYHVILIQSTKGGNSSRSSGSNMGETIQSAIATQVLDMDSRLSFPSSLDDYLNATFQLDFVDGKTKNKFAPKFRVVRAELFLQNFYSDRMHMYQDGKWNAPPPKYDCILTDVRNMKLKKKGTLSNLNDYISMSGEKGRESSVMGEVLTMPELRTKFGA